MKSVKVLSGLALGLAIASPAFAEIESYSYNFPAVGQQGLDILSPSAFTGVQLFNANPVTRILDSVTYKLTADITASQDVENRAAQAQNITVTSSATFTLQKPDLSTLVATIPSVANIYPLPVFDGIIDYAGTSGASVTGLTANNNNSVTTTLAADLLFWTGAGTINLPLTALGNTSGTGSPSLSVGGTIQGSALLEITYTYHSEVPEPKVYGAIGAVACLGLLGYRRYRNSRQA